MGETPDGGAVMQQWRELSRRLRLASESLEPILKSAGTGSLADFEALELLAGSPAGALPQRSIQESLGLSQSGTSRLATRMERSGLLRRTASPSDARASSLEITAEGRSVVARHRASFEEQARLAISAMNSPVNAHTSLAPHAETGGVLRFGESMLSVASEAITVVDAINVRDVLEPLILIEAAQFRTDEDIRDCERILADMAARLGDAKRFYLADWALHRRLASICRNDLLHMMYLALLSTLQENVDDVVPTDGLNSYLRRRLVVHTEIIDAVASGDLERVRAAATSHAITGHASTIMGDAAAAST